jgi:hypothetical protein
MPQVNAAWKSLLQEDAGHRAAVDALPRRERMAAGGDREAKSRIDLGQVGFGDLVRTI